MAPTAQLEYENPYQSSATLAETMADTSATDELLELRAFVGSRFDRYYFRKWRPRLEDPDHGDVGVNWAALLVTIWWMGYRKMYGQLLVFLVASAAVLIGLRAVFVYGLHQDDAPLPAILISWVVVQFVCFLYGNAWYLQHAQNEIKRLKNRGYKGNELLLQAARRGGTSGLGIVLGLVMSGMVTVIGNLIALSLKLPV